MKKILYCLVIVLCFVGLAIADQWVKVVDGSLTIFRAVRSDDTVIVPKLVKHGWKKVEQLEAVTSEDVAWTGNYDYAVEDTKVVATPVLREITAEEKEETLIQAKIAELYPAAMVTLRTAAILALEEDKVIVKEVLIEAPMADSGTGGD